jgi:purine nucleosidase
VIAYLLRPGLFQGREARVEIETEGTLTLGRTVVDFRRRGGFAANARVIERVDAEGLFSLLTERLARFA